MLLHLCKQGKTITKNIHAWGIAHLARNCSPRGRVLSMNVPPNNELTAYKAQTDAEVFNFTYAFSPVMGLAASQ